jgi:cytochrome c-type biogenesis protein CcmH
VIALLVLALLASDAAPTRLVAPLETDADVAFAIGKGLRCPVCQGMPIAESPSDMAQSMMGRIRELVAEGKSRSEIEAYFVERYGEWVLLAPTTEGVNVLVWILPPLALAAGILLALRALRKKSGDMNRMPATSPAAADDPYLAAVRRAVEDGEG